MGYMEPDETIARHYPELKNPLLMRLGSNKETPHHTDLRLVSIS